MSDPPWKMVVPQRVSTDPRRHGGHAALLSLNQVEQDYQAVKRITRPMLGFKSFMCDCNLWTGESSGRPLQRVGFSRRGDRNGAALHPLMVVGSMKLPSGLPMLVEPHCSPVEDRLGTSGG
jgi:hypothetical protein